MPKEQLHLGSVQETLLIPLYGRAVESRKENGLLFDPSAIEMVEAIDYNFSKWDGKPSLASSCLRTLAFDHWVTQFLQRSPAGTVIELGAGLNTRYERLDNTLAEWFELDLPDTMALRETFFAETSNRHMIAASVTDSAWIAQVKASPGPYCFCAEALLIYLPEAEVKQVFAQLAHHFPGSELLFDSMTALMQKNLKRHDIMKDMQASFNWVVQHPQELEAWGPNYHLRESLTMPDLFVLANAHQIPIQVRALYGILRWLYPPFVNAYRVNRMQLGGTLPSQAVSNLGMAGQ